MAPLSIGDDQPRRPERPPAPAPLNARIPMVPLYVTSISMFQRWRNYFEVAAACNNLSQQETYEDFLDCLTEEVMWKIDAAGQRHRFYEAQHYSELLEMLQTILFPGADSEAKRAAFFEAKQREDESISDFMERIERLFSEAYPDTTYLAGMRYQDQMVVGFREPEDVQTATRHRQIRVNVERGNYHARRQEGILEFP